MQNLGKIDKAIDFPSCLLFQEETTGVKGHHFDKHINDLKYKILRDRSYDNNVRADFNLPPYLRKRNRRYKSIYETMHANKPQQQIDSQYGHVEYQQFLHKNEIPDADLLTQLMKKSMKAIEHDHHHRKQHKKHQLSRSHQRIKKLRSKPEAGIMQKKLKI